LHDCLRAYSTEEQLSSTDTWYCADCKEHVEAFKKLSISLFPKILVVHLKRFSYRGSFRERIDELVKFPIVDLDISNFVEEQEDGQLMKYDLFAISNHFGSLGGGHYTAFVRGRNDTSKWFRCDDGSVNQVDPSGIVTDAAYVLFYVRQDVDWPPFTESVAKSKNSDEENSEIKNLNDDDEYESETDEEEEGKQEQAESNNITGENVNRSNEESTNPEVPTKNVSDVTSIDV